MHACMLSCPSTAQDISHLIPRLVVSIPVAQSLPEGNSLPIVVELLFASDRQRGSLVRGNVACYASHSVLNTFVNHVVHEFIRKSFVGTCIRDHEAVYPTSRVFFWYDLADGKSSGLKLACY